jgi:hypothetical protein
VPVTVYATGDDFDAQGNVNDSIRERLRAALAQADAVARSFE